MIENESGEDYLEAILRLSSKKPDVHSVEISRELGVSKPAVTKAVRLLTQKGYVKVEKNHIFLTEEGKAYAEAVYERHLTLTSFLKKLGVTSNTAECDACRIEHFLSEETFEAVKRFVEKNDLKAE